MLRHYFELETVEGMQTTGARHDFGVPVSDRGEFNHNLIERRARSIVNTRAIIVKAENVSKT